METIEQELIKKLEEAREYDLKGNERIGDYHKRKNVQLNDWADKVKVYLSMRHREEEAKNEISNNQSK